MPGRPYGSRASALEGSPAYATEIATVLCDLHKQGLAYGAVSSQLILVSQAGASLRSSGGLTRLGDARGDVIAFGAVLDEMCRAQRAPLSGLSAEVSALAQGCSEEEPNMRQVVINLRLMAMQSRLSANGPVRRPVLVPAKQTAVTMPVFDVLRGHLQIAPHWRPLAHLAAFSISK